jgi:hypothetical protein
MKKIINFIICKLKSHTMVQAGTCPYSNKNYNNLKIVNSWINYIKTIYKIKVYQKIVIKSPLNI